MKLISTIILIAAVMSPHALASTVSATQQLGVCLTDSMNGKERKNLAKWIYFGMSQHSTIKPYSNVSDANLDQMNKYVGELITRLITKDCKEISNKAMEENSAAFESAFSIVGKVAMQELMTESSVSQSLGAFEKYLDTEKIEAALK
ncbi:hypothetical protein ACRN9Z_02385 [Shewanella frigidimarina]|uniref:hypothetical protein n=1 Tax=Shewanella TaxID=22 RepID=UPI001601981B|nr:hypothetical protein [Shewanella sp. SG44-2]MBB1427022.1 hypothetical protein [Shewanella sp. SG44-2]|tara:strand:- start:4367 stop:4807 length:441 start_codon:yes stop_codon:yes gene_type:complete